MIIRILGKAKKGLFLSHWAWSEEVHKENHRMWATQNRHRDWLETEFRSLQSTEIGALFTWPPLSGQGTQYRNVAPRAGHVSRDYAPASLSTTLMCLEVQLTIELVAWCGLEVQARLWVGAGKWPLRFRIAVQGAGPAAQTQDWRSGPVLCKLWVLDD